MHKKLAATLSIAIFLISTLAIMAPVSAHFTLGDLTPNYRYHANDFDPHVDGVIGYVWPGGGLASYAGFPGVFSNQLSPGYQSPYPGGNPPGAPSNALQLEGDTYAPFGAILTDSTGDLIFAVNATAAFEAAAPNGGEARFSSLFILIPPEFTVPEASQVTTTITNNGAFILVYHLGPLDAYAPGWTLVRILGDRASVFGDGSQNIGTNGRITFSTARNEWYYVRVNGVKAPSVAGRYFFKMYLTTTSTSTGVITNPGVAGATLADGNYFVPVENWPVLLVKGEIDPAIVTGTVRYGGYNSTLYGTGVGEAGRVWAKMTTRLDPYTGQTRADLPLVDAVGYFNATARGHYEVEGLAPGTYEIYASAAGFPQSLCATGVTVLRGQSLHFDCYLNPGPVIHGNVYTKHQFGEEPWPSETQTYPDVSPPSTVGEYIKIELYDNPTLNHQVDTSAGAPVSWSPIPCVAGGRDLYSAGYDAALCGDPRMVDKNGLGIEVAFPWHEYTLANGYTNSPIPAAPTQPGGGAGITQNAPGVYADPAGVGPPQTWTTQGGTTTPFHFEFGVKAEYGAPRDMDGHVPQIFATWINGLTPGRYYARAWVFRYVQSALDGSTFQEYSFDVTPNEWAGDVTLPIDLRLSSWVNKTVYFHNLPGTIVADGINTGANFLVAAMYDANGKRFAYNVTTLPLPATAAALGIDPTYPDHGPLDPANLNQFCNTPGRPEYGHCNVQLWGYNDTWVGQNYGIPSGTYDVKAWALGYLQQTTESVSVTLSGNPTSISDHLYRGVGFNLTVYSIDWQRPRVNRNWLYPDADIGVAILDAQANFVAEECAACDGYPPPDPYDPYRGELVPTTSVDTNNPGIGYNLNQNGDTYWTQANGGGVNVLPTDNAQGAFFGLDCVYCLVGGYWSRTGGFHTGFTRNTNWVSWKATFYATGAFDSGQYSFRGWTLGYIQNKDFTIYANKGQVADIKINLIIGVNVTLDILFKKESIITPTPNPTQARVRLFNDQGSLVSEWFSSMGVDAATGSELSATDPFNLPGQAIAATVPTDGPSVGEASFGDDYNYLPGGVSLLHIQLHGLPAYQADFGDTIFTTPRGDFEVDWWGDVTHFPNAGILGAPDYTGGWTAEVDFVNIYRNSTYPLPADPGQNDITNFYPPVQGLLMGESYHIIPGTTATSSISFTEDNALDSFYLGHSMAPNHLGPYSQQGVWAIQNAPNSGEASGIFEVDLNGLVSGNALAFTWSNEFRPLSWGLVHVVGASGASWDFYTYDGIYEAYLTPGTYQFTISSPGYTDASWSVAVSPGQSGTGQNVYMEQNNIPVPEFTGIAIVAFSALAASLYLLRRRRR